MKSVAFSGVADDKHGHQYNQIAQAPYLSAQVCGESPAIGDALDMRATVDRDDERVRTFAEDGGVGLVDSRIQSDLNVGALAGVLTGAASFISTDKCVLAGAASFVSAGESRRDRSSHRRGNQAATHVAIKRQPTWQSSGNPRGNQAVTHVAIKRQPTWQSRGNRSGHRRGNQAATHVAAHVAIKGHSRSHSPWHRCSAA